MPGCLSTLQSGHGPKCGTRCFAYSDGTSIAPLEMSSMTSWGARPSMVQPTLCAVPSTSLQVPESSRAIDRGRITRAMLITSSKVMLPLCLTISQNKNEKKTHNQHGERSRSGDHLASRAGITARLPLTILTVFHLLAIAWRFLQGFHD